jgi:1-acyl-sn-glycerol-3-phosphate acyltransferase
VVPVALNSGLFWGRRAFIKKPGTIVVQILPPIPPGLDRKAFMRDLESRIEPASTALAKG